MESTISVGCQWSLFKSINLALTWLSHKYQKGNSHLLHSEYLHVYRRTTQQTDKLSQKSTGRLFFKRWVQCTFWAYSCPSSNCIQQIWTLITPFWQQIDTHLQINRILQAKRRHITVTVMGSSLNCMQCSAAPSSCAKVPWSIQKLSILTFSGDQWWEVTCSEVEWTVKFECLSRIYRMKASWD